MNSLKAILVASLLLPFAAHAESSDSLGCIPRYSRKIVSRMTTKAEINETAAQMFLAPLLIAGPITALTIKVGWLEKVLYLLDDAAGVREIPTWEEDNDGRYIDEDAEIEIPGKVEELYSEIIEEHPRLRNITSEQVRASVNKGNVAMAFCSSGDFRDWDEVKEWVSRDLKRSLKQPKK